MAIDPLKNYPGYALRRASAAAMADLAERLTALELRPTESSVLLIIDANLNVTQSEIGRMLEIASANMAPLISRLEARDLIEREPVDGRSHGLNLSTTGRALTAKVKKAVQAHETALLAKIPAAERAAFLSGLRALWSSEDE
ncbi:MAG: MarR family winged helix-turn-helix transcriptional regulator [Steroidobacteraceae bacterium]